MTNHFFETYEQYTSYRAAWSAAVNDERAKSTLAKHDEMFYDSVARKCITTKDSGQHKVPGWVKAEHFVLFNYIKGRSLNRGFSEITSKSKIISNNEDPFDGFNKAVKHLINVITVSNSLIKDLSDPDSINNDTSKAFTWRNKIVTEFLAPYNGSITMENLTTINTGILTDGLIKR